MLNVLVTFVSTKLSNFFNKKIICSQIMFQGIIKSDELAANVKWISYDIFNTWLKTATSC